MATYDINKEIELLWNHICGKEVKEVYKVFRNVMNYMIDNPEDQITKNIKNWLLTNMQEEFLNPNLVSALNIPDEQKYLKQVTVFKELPFMLHRNEFISYFNDLIVKPSDYFGTHQRFYRGCRWFFNEMGNNPVPDSTFESLDNYYDNNITVYRGGFNHYDSYETELKRLRDINNRIIPDDWEKESFSIEYDMRRNGETYDIFDIISSYKAKKIGIIGEYDAAKTTIPKGGIFVAKDYGNGFGYDYFYLLKTNLGDYENLYEVKSTLNNDGDDYFSMSDNEYNVLMDTLNRPNTEYRIVRVFVDLNLNERFYTKLLKFENGKFISTNNDDNKVVEYNIDPDSKGHVFRRKKPIIKTLKNE